MDIAGRIVGKDTPSPVDSADAQWLKRNIKAQALPNGRCALPTGAADCPHANACLTCVHFRTDATFLPIHKAQFAQTNRIVETANRNGWARMAEMNTRVAQNLERIIIALELRT